jgi:hypothetical protein
MALIISHRSSCRPNFATAPFIVWLAGVVVTLSAQVGRPPDLRTFINTLERALIIDALFENVLRINGPI